MEVHGPDGDVGVPAPPRPKARRAAAVRVAASCPPRPPAAPRSRCQPSRGRGHIRPARPRRARPHRGRAPTALGL